MPADALRMACAAHRCGISTGWTIVRLFRALQDALSLPGRGGEASGRVPVIVLITDGEIGIAPRA